MGSRTVATEQDAPMTLPQQDAVEEARRRAVDEIGGAQHDLRHGIDPRVFDPSREPFAAPPGVDPSTGVINDRGREDVTRRPWPPRSGGPLPPAERIPPDLNIFTAQDEIDAWAHEHDAATTALESIRRRRADLQIEVMKARMKYRRVARANPVERGRRTADDIAAEVDEALANDPQFVELEHATVELETQMGRLFRAKDNIARLDSYVRSLPRVSDRP
jgi:nucleotide-binding universal stress UspA family protein